MTAEWTESPTVALRPGEDFDINTFDRGSTPGYEGNKADGKEFMAERGVLLSELQERLFAHGRSDGTKSVLLVIQGLDTAGKGGIVRHVMGMVDPQGVQLASFGVPTKEELSHHFLWRIKKELPEPGKIGVFDRSHYEDVLVQRVENIVEEEVWRKRYDEINRFEKRLVENGTTIIKVALMCSKDEQAARILERIERPDKKWKHNPGDLDTRAKWDDYQEAYSDVFTFTSTDYAPWHVIPADKKWYARLAVTELLTQALIDLKLTWPKPRWQADVQRRRLLATVSDEVAEALLADVQDEITSAAEDHKEFLEAVVAADDGLSAEGEVSVEEKVKAAKEQFEAAKEAPESADEVTADEVTTSDDKSKKKDKKSKKKKHKNKDKKKSKKKNKKKKSKKNKKK